MFLALLATAFIFFLLGAFVDSKYHDKFAAKFAEDKAALIDEYNTLLAKSHAERDAFLAHFRHAVPAVAPLTPAATPILAAPPAPAASPADIAATPLVPPSA